MGYTAARFLPGNNTATNATKSTRTGVTTDASTVSSTARNTASRGSSNNTISRTTSPTTSRTGRTNNHTSDSTTSHSSSSTRNHISNGTGNSHQCRSHPWCGSRRVATGGERRMTAKDAITRPGRANVEGPAKLMLACVGLADNDEGKRPRECVVLVTA
jgi:hypothetical protein